jgi:hypothetical protein
VRIAPGGRVKGDLHGTGISIDEGAEFAGRLDAEFELPPELGGSEPTPGFSPARPAGARSRR